MYLLEIECIPLGIAGIIIILWNLVKISLKEDKMSTNNNVRRWPWWIVLLVVFIVLALVSPLVWKYWLWAFAPHVEAPTTTCEPIDDQSVQPAEDSQISCVTRMGVGEKANVFTETWDSERRVWIHLNGGTCNGPYCFSYDQCSDPISTLHVQPFWTGHELSPVDGKPFDICYNFEGSCSR